MSSNDGVSRINGERMRQLRKYTYAGDDAHADGRLVIVASALCLAGYEAPNERPTFIEEIAGDVILRCHDEDGNVTDKVRLLEVAGALIAAEIDRLVRLSYKQDKQSKQTQEGK